MPVYLSHNNADINGGCVESRKDTKQHKTVRSKENDAFLVWSKKPTKTVLEDFKKVIEEKYNLHFDSYWDLHKWTVTKYPCFWEEVWSYFGIVTSKPYDEVFVRTGPGFLDNEWFSGAEFNYAENVLRIRDNREALLCLDEDGKFDKVTFSEMFEEVKLYAAAFRKHGLQKGDRVACYMSNRKEAVFGMLAATSIGAVWGGPQPYYGARAASNIINRLAPKFLIVVDKVEDEGTGEEYNMIDNISLIAESATTLEKIIIVPTKPETLSKDISHISNSCFLGPFLESGRTQDGEIPDIIFEQLPSSHPLFISFSSGTTGLPKGPVHSAGSMVGPMVDFALHYNLKSGDILYSIYPMGWTLWNYFVSSLSLGLKLFLHCGRVYETRDGNNMWDIIAEHKVSFTFLVTSIVDKMEKMNLKPKANTSFENLKVIKIGGSPVKVQNYKYIQSIVKEDVYIGSLYGATETSGTFSGCEMNLPCYAPEVQVPALGKDIQCFDQNGRPVIGQRGEMVVTIPCPTFPIGLWKDVNNEILNRVYLAKYPGLWHQHDECYINPRTNGIVVLGRSDDTMIQHGERFGSADIYFAIHDIEEIEDYICVGQNKSNGDSRAVLFVKMKEGHSFTPEFKEKVARKIESELWVDCVPAVILEAKDIPYNINNKRVESVIRSIVATNQLPKVMNLKNPTCLKYYCNIPEIINYDKE